MIAIHARRSAAAVEFFKARHPNRAVLVVVSGTDLHLDLKDETKAAIVHRSLELADRIVLLEPKGKTLLPVAAQEKSVVIYQSAEPVDGEIKKNSNSFDVVILGHLRPVKDPFLAVAAANQLPANSKIQIFHYGVALNDEMEKLANEHSANSDRYQWRGVLSHMESQRILASSRLVLLTSKFEGAPSVISEACVNGVPVLATKITATVGLLGDDYPGLFDVGNEKQLADLLYAAETDVQFYNSLFTAIEKQKSKFSLENERRAWKALLQL